MNRVWVCFLQGGAAAGVNYLNPFMPRKLNLSLSGFTNLASCAYLFFQ